MTETFFKLLRMSLWQQGEGLPQNLKLSEVSEITKIAEKQAVAGLVLDTITRNNIIIPRETLFEILGLQEQIKYQSWKTNKGVVALHKALSASNVYYIIVKGQVLAAYYPIPLLRQSGDIDFYCSGSYYEKALQVVHESWNVTADIHGSKKHADFKHDGIYYEGHFILTDLLNKKNNEYFQSIIDNDEGATIEIDGEWIKSLSPTTHVLFVFLHLWYHLMALGVGLRQFCDMAVLLHYINVLKNREIDQATKGQANLDELRGHLNVLGMDRVWSACGSILVDYLGLSEEEVGYSLSDADRKYGKRIFDIVMYRGNMGHHNKLGGFSGWTHKIEAMGIKMSHFFKLYALAPSYTSQWLWHEIMRINKA